VKAASAKGPVLAAIGIIVADMSESFRFYRMFGLDLPNKPKKGQDHVEARTASGLRVLFDTIELIKTVSPGWKKAVGHRMVLAFECASPALVDKTYAKILKAGFRGAAAPWDAFWGQRYAQVLDPDGNKVDLFAALPS
jgi:uncharacterized glyoxalase superfamily protein PhnB